MKLTKSQEVILGVVKQYSETWITPKEISQRVKYADRTIRSALKRLISLGILKRIPHINKDMRSYLYSAVKVMVV